MYSNSMMMMIVSPSGSCIYSYVRHVWHENISKDVKIDIDTCISFAGVLMRVQDMAETTQPQEIMKKKKPEGFEELYRDKIEVINFNIYRLHLYCSLTLYRIIIIGQKDSSINPQVFNMIYQSLAEYCLKDPNYAVYLPLYLGESIDFYLEEFIPFWCCYW